MVDNEESQEEPKKPIIHGEKEAKKHSFIKWIAGFLFIATWITLIIIRWQTDISLKWPLVISIILSTIFLGAIFGGLILDQFKKLKEKVDKEEKLPKAITEEQVEEILKKTVDKLMNHIKQRIFTRSDEVNKNIIYTFKIKLLYEEDFGEECYIIINANFPEKIPTILPATMTDYYLGRAINSKSSNPEALPDVIKTSTSNPILGIEQKTEEIKHHKKHKPEKKQEESVV